MTRYVPTSSQTGPGPLVTLQDGDSLYVGPAVTLSATSGAVVNTAGRVEIEVDGRLDNNRLFAAAIYSTISPILRIGVNGSINGTVSASELYNRGTLTALGGTIAYFSTLFRNEGLVNATEYYSHGVLSTTGLLINTGAIYARYGDAVYASRIQNSGLIQGDGVSAITAGDPLDLTNESSGRIVGRVLGSYRGDTVINSGTFTGTMLLRDGSDIYDGRGGGVVYGLVSGGEGDDVLYGGPVADKLSGDAGADKLYGGSGANDFAYKERGFGDDVIYGFSPGDRIDLSGMRVAEFEQITRFISQSGPDALIKLGYNGLAETIRILNYTASQLTASDFVFDTTTQDVSDSGRFVRDVLFGNSGSNQLRGYEGDDEILAGPGHDYVDGGAGDDYIDGGAGVDQAMYYNSPGGVTVDLRLQGVWQATGSAGADLLLGVENLSGTEYADVLTGDAGVNILTGYGGDDFLDGQGGSGDVFEGGNGADTVSFSAAAAGIAADMRITTGFQETGGAGSVRFSSIEGLAGTPFPDRFIGNAARNTFSGGAGDDVLSGDFGADILYGNQDNDVLYGNQDADVLYGGQGSDVAYGGQGDDVAFGNLGDDVLYGNLGDDVLNGGVGINVMDGGDGVDTASWADAAAGVRVSLALQGSLQATGVSTDTLSGFENLTGSAFADALVGDGGANALSGGGGDDVLSGGFGGDTLTGGAGADVLYGNQDDDVLRGEADADVLFGGQGSDRLEGGDGADVLQGGVGADVLAGGAGMDVFRYLLATDSTPAASDVLTDFASGQDRIDLRAVSTGAGDRFDLAADGVFTTLWVDLGGDGQADMKIVAVGPIQASDLIWA